MPYEIWATCPQCDELADGYDELIEKFGLRKISGGKQIPQSYCRKCRSKK